MDLPFRPVKMKILALRCIQIVCTIFFQIEHPILSIGLVLKIETTKRTQLDLTGSANDLLLLLKYSPGYLIR